MHFLAGLPSGFGAQAGVFLRVSFLFLALALLLAGCDSKPKPSPKPISKRAPWPLITPADAHLKGEALAIFSKAVGGNGVIVRHDAIAFSWGQPNRPLDVASASKPVMAHLVFKAIADQRISSLDEPVVKWIPELGALNPALDHKDAKITWRHLVNQTSCYGVVEAPGTAFDYNDYQTALLWTLLYEKVNAGPRETITERVLRPQLFDLIGAEDKPMLRIQPEPKVNGRLVISPRDFARLGLLYLHGGNWQGQQVFPAADVSTALGNPLPPSLPRTHGKDAEMLPNQRSYGGGKNQEEHLGCYSFMWWLNRGQKLWPSVPADAFAAVGNGGLKVMLVVPSLDLIVSWNDANLKALPMYLDGRVQMEAVLAKLMLAVER